MKTPLYIEDIEDWKQSFQFSVPVKVRFSETDAFGHLNNTKAFVYFEEVRIEFYRSLGLMADPSSTEMLVVADQQCDYIRQIHFDERLSVYIKVKHVGRSSIDFHYMVLNEAKELCLTGRGVSVQVNKQTGQSMPWNENLRTMFLQELEK